MSKWQKNVAGQIATVMAYQDDGVTPVVSADVALVLAQLKLRSTGNAYAAAAGTLLAVVDGEFEYTATQAETNHDGTITIYLYEAATYAPSRTYVDIATATTADSIAIAAAVLAALEAWEHDTDATFAGLCIRLEAFIANQFTTTGAGTAKHRKFFKRDGVTVAFEGDFDNSTASRGTCDITGSE